MSKLEPGESAEMTAKGGKLLLAECSQAPAQTGRETLASELSIAGYLRIEGGRLLTSEETARIVSVLRPRSSEETAVALEDARRLIAQLLTQPVGDLRNAPSMITFEQALPYGFVAWAQKHALPAGVGASPLVPRLAEQLADVVMMLDTPDAYNREYIAAVCRSILSTVTRPHQRGSSKGRLT